MSFYCGKHNLYGFFGLYSYCPYCEGVSTALLEATRARMVREARLAPPVAKPVVRLVSPPPKAASRPRSRRATTAKLVVAPPKRFVVQLQPPRVMCVGRR